jgi:hypothetical protein
MSIKSNGKILHPFITGLYGLLKAFRYITIRCNVKKLKTAFMGLYELICISDDTNIKKIFFDNFAAFSEIDFFTIKSLRSYSHYKRLYKR